MPLDPAQKCCLLCVCCECHENREKKQAAMAALQTDGVLSTSIEEDHSQASKVLDWIFDNFDLVPKGLGQAIVKAYRPIFETAHKVTASGTGQRVGQGLNKNYDTDDDEAMFNPALPVNPNK